jgi:hypothetical protein
MLGPGFWVQVLLCVAPTELLLQILFFFSFFCGSTKSQGLIYFALYEMFVERNFLIGTVLILLQCLTATMEEDLLRTKDSSRQCSSGFRCFRARNPRRNTWLFCAAKLMVSTFCNVSISIHFIFYRGDLGNYLAELQNTQVDNFYYEPWPCVVASIFCLLH